MDQAIVRLQGRGKGPFAISVPEFPIEKGSVTDIDVMHHMTRLGLISARDHPMNKPEAVLATVNDDDENPERPPESDGQAGLSELEPAALEDAEDTPSARQGDLNELSSSSGGTSDTAIDPGIALLHDVERYPDSGIAERYKRLGLSVRQGQRIKNALIDQELIREELQTIRTGKLRVIRLTEQGRLRLSDQPDSASEAA